MPSSSTSIATSANLDQQAHRNALRALAIFVVVLASATIVARVVLRLGAEDEPSRLKLLMPAFDTLAPEANHRLVLVVGSSGFQAAFSPRIFDTRSAEHGVPTTSFNLSSVAVSPELERVIAERGVEALSRRELKADAVYVEFTPTFATLRSRSMDSANEPRLASLVRPRDVWQAIPTSPSHALRIATLLALGRHLPGELTPRISDRLFPEDDAAREPLQQPPGPPELAALQAMPVAQRLRKRRMAEAPWEPRLRGEFFPITEPDEIDWTERMNALDRTRPAQRRNNIAEFDSIDLELDPDRVKDFVAAFDELRRVSPKVYVVLLPRPSSFQISPLGRTRLNAVLERFRDRGMPVLDYLDAPTISDGDFKDVIHLNHYSGRSKLTSALADHWASQASAP